MAAGAVLQTAVRIPKPFRIVRAFIGIVFPRCFQEVNQAPRVIVAGSFYIFLLRYVCVQGDIRRNQSLVSLVYRRLVVLWANRSKVNATHVCTYVSRFPKRNLLLRMGLGKVRTDSQVQH